jgi:hypothetical protein
MDRAELARRLRTRRIHIAEELGRQIHYIEEIEASLQALEGDDITVPLFPPQNPFRDVPVRRIDAETYVLVARQIIGRQTPDQVRVPGAQKVALLWELEQRCREVRRLIASLDREIEQIEAQRAQDNNLTLYPRGRQVIDDRDNLRTELQFYLDLIEALNFTPTRVTPEERAEANIRARTWVENLGQGRNRRNQRNG